MITHYGWTLSCPIILRDVRELVLQAYAADAIDEEECLLLYDINHSGNLDPPYWKYRTFVLDYQQMMNVKVN